MTISIIVPIYNIERYLPECIESLIGQTWREIEIILVNDGSTDGCGYICEQYAARDERITAIHKKNGGLVSARKAGLYYSRGQYVLYVDGDDWVEPEMVETLVRQHENEPADMICFAAYEEAGEYRTKKRNHVKEGVYKGKKEMQQIYEKMLMDGIFYEQGILAYIWCKFFRRDVLYKAQETVPNEIVYGEDAACVYPALLESKSVRVTNLPLYHYRNRRESLARGAAVDGRNLQNLYVYLYQYFLRYAEKDILIRQLNGLVKSIFLLKDCNLPVCDLFMFPYSNVSENQSVVIYGAGLMGQSMMRRCKMRGIRIAGWADQNASFYCSMGWKVIPPSHLKELSFDKIILAILNSRTAKMIERELVCFGIHPKKISRVSETLIEKERLPEWLTSASASR